MDGDVLSMVVALACRRYRGDAIDHKYGLGPALPSLMHVEWQAVRKPTGWTLWTAHVEPEAAACYGDGRGWS